MLVTITTDASHSPDFKVGAFAFWITSELGRIKMAGPLDGQLINPTQAEVRCIVNAVYFLRKHSKWPDIDAVVINTDSMQFINMVDNSSVHHKLASQYTKELGIFKQLTRRWRVHLKHVRAHEHKETKRNWVNDWCDKEAKRQLRVLVQSIKSESGNDPAR